MEDTLFGVKKEDIPVPKEMDTDELKDKFRTLVSQFVPYDPRFPNTNQTKNCQVNYVDYFKCLKAKNGDEKYCEWYKNAYTSLCPNEWIEKWDEQRENNAFAPLRESKSHGH